MNTTTRTSPKPAPAVDFFAAKPAALALLLLAAGLVFAGLGVWALVATGWGGKPDDPAAGEAFDPYRGQKILGGTLGLLGAAVGLILGGLTYARAADPDPSGPAARRQVRVTLLLAGGLFGLVLMLAGVCYFVAWFDSLGKWINGGDPKEARWVLGPLVVFLFGAGLAFAGTVAARGEERNDEGLRKLAYGTNLGLTAVLLLFALVVANVVFALRVPNKLDATAGGFFTLSPETEKYLADLGAPVTAYAVLSPYEDTAPRLLDEFADAAPGKFQVRKLDQSRDRDEIKQLAAKYPQADLREFGILLTAGPDGSRHSFIRENDLYTRPAGSNPEGGRALQFQGESLVVRELLYLSDTRAKPVVYFTQGHGEIQVGPPAGVPPDAPARSGGRLKALLDRNYLEVKTWLPDLADPKVPDDADILVVAGPTLPFPKEEAAAVRKFLAEPRKNGKKGKLVLLAGATAKANRKVVVTGLEEVLLEHQVKLGNEFLLGQPVNELPHEIMVVVPNPRLGTGATPNPVAAAYKDSLLLMPLCRTVEPAGEGGGPLRVEPLLLVIPDRFTWLEPELPRDARRAWNELVQNADARKAKRLARSARPVAVAVSEGETARLAVVGCDQVFADAAGRGEGGQAGAELLGNIIDWLRDRPAAASIANKTFGEYAPKARPDETRLVWLPLGLAVFTIAALGAGVWVVRRK